MRFDDMLATLLAQPLDTPAARAAAWRQIVDILAQGHGRQPHDLLVDEPRSADAYNLLEVLRAEVPAAIRIEAARSLAGRLLPIELVALFAEEPPVIAAPLLGKALMPDEDWVALLPRLGPTARGFLRHRRDLSARVQNALDSFGASDFVIAAPEVAVSEPVAAPVPAVEAVDGETQIRDLLSRIQTFRARRATTVAAPLPAARKPDADRPLAAFRFETGVDGAILWVDGVPRGALIGETIAAAARQADHGVDGQVAGAFRQRAPFRDGRLTIGGDGPAGGEWRISAVPFFERHDGRFTGYRGTARRPRADETTHPVRETGLFGTGMAPDSLRQLVHELKTPLNAILGFSEMIEQQYAGPAAAPYREKAADIVAHGRRLMAAIDDIDLAARIDGQTENFDRGEIDGVALLERLHRDYLPVAQSRGATLHFRIGRDLSPVQADAVAVERMFARLLAATIAIAAAGESIAIEFMLDPVHSERLRLSLVRPMTLAGRDERMLLDPGYNPDGEWPDAPLLGLGFALRLVRNLANAAGGALDIEDDRFVLTLPTRTEPAQIGEHG